jgi:hypothetical protein
MKRWLAWSSMAGATLLFGACAHESTSAQTPEEARLISEQQRSSQALKNATKAQEDANAARANADKAHQDVLDKRAELKTAESKWQNAQLEAQESQAAARQAALTAQSQTAVSQGQALAQQQAVQQQRLKDQQRFHKQEATGQQASVMGVFAGAKENTVRIRNPDDKVLTLDVTPETEVFLDGQHVDLAQLPRGADIRADYSLVKDRPTAIRVEANSPGATPKSTGEQPSPSSQP